MPLSAAHPYAAACPVRSAQLARRTFSYSGRQALNITCLAASDGLAISLSFILAGVIRKLLLGAPMVEAWEFWVIPFWWAAAGVHGILPGWGLSPVESLRRQVGLISVGFAGLTAALFLTKSGADASRLTLFMGFALAFPLVPLLRMQTRTLLCRHGLWGVPVAIYGAGGTGRLVAQRLREEPGQGYSPICFFDDDARLAGREVDGLPVLGATSGSTRGAPVAILAMPGLGGRRMSVLMEGPLAGYRRVVVLPDLLNSPSLWVACRDLGGLPSLEIARNLLDPGRILFKRAIDVLATWLTLPLWGPLCGGLALLIWLEDRRNPFFLQERLGLNGRVFKTWKFRTMVPDAEAILRRKLETDPEFRRDWESSCKLKHDPRITRVGQILRKTSLDEVPQLINVLRGEMSLVGPRPLPQYHHEQLPASVTELRDRVRPGMTGLWQVSGRSESGNSGIVRWDSYYVRNWSIWLDIVILVRTVRAVVRGSGAY
jgi:Undecaprenyl-phosphate galactose phosphotransferase WbaP